MWTGRAPRPPGRRARSHIPHRDVVVHGLGLQQGEVDVDPVAGRHGDQPQAVLQDRVLIGKSGGVDRAVLRRDVVPARS